MDKLNGCLEREASLMAHNKAKEAWNQTHKSRSYEERWEEAYQEALAKLRGRHLQLTLSRES